MKWIVFQPDRKPDKITGRGHFTTGVIVAIASYPLSVKYGLYPIVVALALAMGSSAPDWLEMPWNDGNRRRLLINHRTLTHWWPIWAYLLWHGLKIGGVEGNAMVGFAIGCLLHLLTDLPNPMGIPILTPWHRFSLNLWKSGHNEILIILVAFVFMGWSYSWLDRVQMLAKNYLA